VDGSDGVGAVQWSVAFPSSLLSFCRGSLGLSQASPTLALPTRSSSPSPPALSTSSPSHPLLLSSSPTPPTSPKQHARCSSSFSIVERSRRSGSDRKGGRRRPGKRGRKCWGSWGLMEGRRAWMWLTSTSAFWLFPLRALKRRAHPFYPLPEPNDLAPSPTAPPPTPGPISPSPISPVSSRRRKRSLPTSTHFSLPASTVRVSPLSSALPQLTLSRLYTARALAPISALQPVLNHLANRSHETEFVDALLQRLSATPLPPSLPIVSTVPTDRLDEQLFADAGLEAVRVKEIVARVLSVRPLTSCFLLCLSLSYAL
jgi:hypothetical protein